MQPTFEFSIDAMIRALTGTVRPAIDPQDKAASEQLAIVVGALNVLRSQVDYAHWFETVDARDMGTLVETLAGLADLPSSAEARAAVAAARGVIGRSNVSLSALRAANSALRGLTSALMEEAHALDAPALHAQVDRVVLDHSKAQVARERAYVAGAGFDVFPDDLQTIEAALTAAA